MHCKIWCFFAFETKILCFYHVKIQIFFNFLQCENFHIVKFHIFFHIVKFYTMWNFTQFQNFTIWNFSHCEISLFFHYCTKLQNSIVQFCAIVKKNVKFHNVKFFTLWNSSHSNKLKKKQNFHTVKTQNFSFKSKKTSYFAMHINKHIFVGGKKSSVW